MREDEDSDEIYIDDDSETADVDYESFLDFDWDDFYDDLEGLDDAEDEDYG